MNGIRTAKIRIINSTHILKFKENPEKPGHATIVTLHRDDSIRVGASDDSYKLIENDKRTVQAILIGKESLGKFMTRERFVVENPMYIFDYPEGP